MFEKDSHQTGPLESYLKTVACQSLTPCVCVCVCVWGGGGVVVAAAAALAVAAVCE